MIPINSMKAEEEAATLRELGLYGPERNLGGKNPLFTTKKKKKNDATPNKRNIRRMGGQQNLSTTSLQISSSVMRWGGSAHVGFYEKTFWGTLGDTIHPLL